MIGKNDQLSFFTLWVDPPPPPPPACDEEFWGPGGKEVFIQNMRMRHALSIRVLASLHGWDLDGNDNPLPPPSIFSMAELASERAVLMAHVMHKLGIFKSVGEAKRNGWDKPIELGDFTVTKKKIRFRIVE